MRNSPDRGFALITVMGVILIVSAVALTLASTMRVEAFQVLGDRTSIELDELSHSGQEVADYLASRGLGSPSEDLGGLPVEAVQPGFHYIVHFPNGDAHLYLDAEDGKLNLSTAPDVLLEGFFTAWSGDTVRGRDLAAAVKDWRDFDDTPQPGGAERETYAPLGYVPRNTSLGVADAGLLRGISRADFQDQLVQEGAESTRRASLSVFLTQTPVGASVNPNYATGMVLRALPGLSPQQIANVLAERQRALFVDSADFARRVGLSQVSPAWSYLHFMRKIPGILSVARSADGRVVRSDRRITVPFSRLNFVTGLNEVEAVHAIVERNFPLDSDDPALH